MVLLGKREGKSTENREYFGKKSYSASVLDLGQKDSTPQWRSEMGKEV